MRPGIRNWERLSRDEQEALQLRRLRKLLKTRILPFSPFYRRRFDAGLIDPDALKSMDDLKRIPFTTKQDLLITEEQPLGPKDFILQPDEELIRTRLPLRSRLGILARGLLLGRERLRARLQWEYNPNSMIFTTGRSTGSVPFFMTPFDQEMMFETGRRITAILRLSPAKDRVFNVFPYAPHLAFWQVAACGMASGILTLNTGGGRIMGGDRLLGALERMKPTTVVGMPGYFYHLLRMAVQAGSDLSSVHTIALGGENVPAGLKRKVAELMAAAGAPDVRVVSVLGFTEARQCWAECPGVRRSGFHTYPDLSLFEIIDPDSGEPRAEGETGELVYTGLEGRGSMVVRYRTGDIVEGGIVRDACPGCGRTVPRLGSDIRRVSNIKNLSIGKVKGTLVNLNTIAELLTDDAEIEEWQLVIGKRGNDAYETDEITLYCALKGSEVEDSFKARIQRQMHQKAELHLNRIEIEDLQSLLDRIGMEELTKEERILDRRGEAVQTSGNPTS